MRGWRGPPAKRKAHEGGRSLGGSSRGRLAWSKAPDSGSGLVGVRGFESLPLHFHLGSNGSRTCRPLPRNMPRPPGPGAALLKDVDGRRWHDSVATRSQATADVRLRDLGAFSLRAEVAPKDLTSKPCSVIMVSTSSSWSGSTQPPSSSTLSGTTAPPPGTCNVSRLRGPGRRASRDRVPRPRFRRPPPPC